MERRKREPGDGSIDFDVLEWFVGVNHVFKFLLQPFLPKDDENTEVLTNQDIHSKSTVN